MNVAAEIDSGWREKVAADLDLLARLQARPWNRATVLAVWERCYDGLLALPPVTQRGREALDRFCEGVTEIPACLDPLTLERLAAGFERVYDGTASAGPFEADWACGSDAEASRLQAGLGARMRAHGFAVAAGRPDGLTVQLAYLAHLVTCGKHADWGAEAHSFVVTHILCWVDRFANGTRYVDGPRMYHCLAVLTATYLGEIADALVGFAEPQAPGYSGQVRARDSLGVRGSDMVRGLHLG